MDRFKNKLDIVKKELVYMKMSWKKPFRMKHTGEKRVNKTKRQTRMKMSNILSHSPKKVVGHWWLMPVILAIQEAEIRRITV
jgi:hypothetical protein